MERKRKKRVNENSSITIENSKNEKVQPTITEKAMPKISDFNPTTNDSKRVKISGLYKPPTHDELQSLKETESLYRTNLIKLQINELLSEISPSKQTNKVETFLHKLKENLEKCPSTPRINLSDGLSLLPKSVTYPLIFLPPSDIKGHFQFAPPTKVKVVGSYLLETGLRNESQNINITLQLPQVCLQDKDYLNYRYFHKRALYLSIIAGSLLKKKKHLLIDSIDFILEKANPLLPVLIIKPKELLQYSIVLQTSVDSQSFPLHKLLPSKNNVRWSAKPHPLTEIKLEVDISSLPPPTPHYNSALLSEMSSRERHLEELYSATLEVPAITEGTLLCKTWLRQRELDKGYGSFNGFHAAMLLLYLLRKRKLNQFMSSYQIFRVFLQYITNSHWEEQGISIADKAMYPSLPSIKEFHSIFPVVFLDSSGFLNLTAHMSLEQYCVLRQEAELSHTLLDYSESSFSDVFLKPVSPLLKYDSICKIPISLKDARKLPLLSENDWGRAVLDNGGWVWPNVTHYIMGVVTKSLEGRVSLIGRLPPKEHSKWPVSQAPPSLDEGHMTLGFIFNTEKIFKPLIMGPPADSNEAISFRKFWGQRSELRRFPDSGINEAVLWAGQNEAEKRTIPFQILNHTLNRHARLSDITFTHTLLDSMLSSFYGEENNTGEELSVGVVNIFNELSRQLRQLKDLPLSIATVKGASSILCHTEVHPFFPWNGKLSSKLQSLPLEENQRHCLYPSCDVATPPLIPCCHVVIQMEASGKWPDDLSAIGDIKTAFYLAISKCLHQQYDITTGVTRDYLDVLKNGYVFRLHIVYLREVSLLRELNTSSSLERAEGIEREWLTRPLIVSTLLGLHNQFPALSMGVRFCKRWVCSHMLANQIPEELIELLVAYLFIHPEPFMPPGTPLCVFLRFLKLFVSHDWSHDPLLINLNNQFNDETIADITSSFSITRERHPLMFVATPIDHTSKLTQSQPNVPVFKRLLALAKTSLELVTKQISSLLVSQENLLDFRQIFRTPLTDYNLLIHLDIKKIAYSQQTTPITQSIKDTITHLPVTQFDTVKLYLNTLEVAYSNLALFFYDNIGGHVIGVVWKPHVFKPHPHKVGDIQCYKTISESGSKLQVAIDKEAIVNDMTILGDGLVTRIEIQS